MSQVLLTQPERVNALTRLGYTGREASFLVIAALHGGYFLRRQFCQYIGKGAGGTAAALIEKVLTKNHGQAITGCLGVHLYHLSARPFYAVLGQEDNRNRRAHPPMVIKNRLMGLDFILEHPSELYLATEQEKVDFFAGTIGIARQDLPHKLYRSPTAKASTARYFVDKSPLFQSGRFEDLLTFSFVDEGAQTGARFVSYLKEYSRLFERVGRFRLTYISTPQTPFQTAEAVFRRHLSAQESAPRTVDIDDLVAHFEDRQLYDQDDLTSFDRARILRLRDQKTQYAGLHFDDLFNLWKRAGRAAIERSLAARQVQRIPMEARFESYIVRHNYDLFGTTLPRAC